MRNILTKFRSGPVTVSREYGDATFLFHTRLEIASLKCGSVVVNILCYKAEGRGIETL
jgi:hypothetical protein